MVSNIFEVPDIRGSWNVSLLGRLREYLGVLGVLYSFPLYVAGKAEVRARVDSNSIP